MRGLSKNRELDRSISETSLSIDDARMVVDAGLARVSRFDPPVASARRPATQAGAAGRRRQRVVGCRRCWRASWRIGWRRTCKVSRLSHFVAWTWPEYSRACCPGRCWRRKRWRCLRFMHPPGLGGVPAGAGGASAGAVRPGRHAAHRRGRLAVNCTCCRPRRPGAAHAGPGGQHVSGCEEGPLKGRYPKLLRNSTLTLASGNSGSFTHARQFETCNLRALTRDLSVLLVQRRYRSQRVLVYWLAPNATRQLQ